MNRRICAALLCIACLGVQGLQAQDYKVLHERAESLSLQEARVQAEEDPASLDRLYILGLAYLNSYDADAAEEVFLRLQEKDPSFIGARWGIAEVLRRKHDYEAAVKILKELITKTPAFAPAYVSLSYIKYMQMEFQASERAAFAVIKMGVDKADIPNVVRAYGLIAGAKGMLAHYGGPLAKVVNGKAIMPYLKKGENISPQAPSVLYGMGCYFFLAPPILGRDYDKAQKYLEEAIEGDPKFPDAYVRLAQVYRIKGDEQKFQEYLVKALTLDPRNELALDIKSGECKFICVEPDSQ
jgi:tetratricopeptide (TPR) repeat protein